MKKNKVFGIIIILCIYLVSLGVGTFLHFKINLDAEQFLLKLLIIDIAMLVIVFIFSCLFHNASIYDSSRGLIPIILTVYAAWILCDFHQMSYIMIVLISIWGLKITLSFFKTLKNLNKQDWKYNHLKNKFPHLWPLINLVGIHLFQTLIVFMGMLSVFKYMETCEYVELNVSTIIAIAITLSAILIEIIADFQLNKFLKTCQNNELINIGLWKRSRHPNYFGEILFWWGIYLVMLSLNDNMWILFLGPLLNTLKYVFICVPLGERHLIEKNPAYLEYKKTTNTFLLFPKKEVEKNN